MTDQPWMKIARNKLGIRETPGPASSPTIMGWAKRLGSKVLGMVYADDSATPWCGLYVAEVMSEAGFTPPPVALRAMSWATWGTACDPAAGAVAVFQRPGGGHVAFLYADMGDSYEVLGGNQSDAVSFARIAKSRCVAVRWPPGAAPGTPLVSVTAGGEMSKNEA